jgi:hypothetical protein
MSHAPDRGSRGPLIAATLLTLAVTACRSFVISAERHTLSSPDGTIRLAVERGIVDTAGPRWFSNPFKRGRPVASPDRVIGIKAFFDVKAGATPVSLTGCALRGFISDSIITSSTFDSAVARLSNSRSMTVRFLEESEVPAGEHRVVPVLFSTSSFNPKTSSILLQVDESPEASLLAPGDSVGGCAKRAGQDRVHHFALRVTEVEPGGLTAIAAGVLLFSVIRLGR